MSDIEKVADVVHESWSHWMKYLFSKCLKHNDGLLIPKDLVMRWQRQLHTPYAELPEKEKESDRTEAKKYLAVLSDKESAINYECVEENIYVIACGDYYFKTFKSATDTTPTFTKNIEEAFRYHVPNNHLMDWIVRSLQQQGHSVVVIEKEK